MDPIKLQNILNKKPREVVTSNEWNEIFNLLIAQANALADQVVNINNTIESILNGDVEGITIEANVDEFGGRTADEYALKTDVQTSQDTVVNYTTTELAKKQNKIVLTPLRLVITDTNGALMVSNTSSQLLDGITMNVQAQLNAKASSTHNHDSAYASTSHNHDSLYASTSHNHDSAYLGISATATNSSKIGGKTLFVQQTQPTANATGDVWISW